ncbi:Beta-alanine--pyruvate aminotransferase [Sinobacterium norvegicum]|uniref:Beta-alanine--pyruvate aminotransferase n=1 Tax=Sinobacterium norvegicum TaxID=1641715 RepID=A0ABM9AAB7_9GAMM|nr:aspartate aminotransferase family protein [Sinobacterium norvegicum]CAH0990080.1 Beta-alanine--pyruvate aminotransferase [Sinobacterium norvegicum]
MANTPQNTMDAYWMPFTANRQFKKTPRIMKAAKGMYYTSDDDRQILDGTAGLWCCNAGHSRSEITQAVSHQIEQLDYAPSFQMSHPLPFELANRLVALAPEGINKVFYTNSGSESVDTALKIAVAYHRIRGEASRTRFVGREKGYHGVGFGGISVGGLVNNRKMFGPLLPGADHLPHTLNIDLNAFSRGLPEHGVELAQALESIVGLHDASTIAAVIVEPLQGSAGVILPAKGYLQALRDICDKYGILLIFDEVITGFGRIGNCFAAEEFGVTPDIITTAKGLTNGAVPMGAVFVSDKIHDTFMAGPEEMIEFFHGYTYSGHPVACAAALASLDIYKKDNLFEKAHSLGQYFEDGAHRLAELEHVQDVRNYGLVAAIDLKSRDGAPGARAFEVFTECYKRGVLIRVTGDIIALSPPLIIEHSHIDELFGTLAEVIQATA